MQDLLSIDNFKGMVTDFGDGKQPQGTCKEIKNLVYDREYGSLVTRYTYENSLARPTGVSTLSKWLTFPTTYPDKNDNHIWFTEDGIFIQPYYHNSSTVTNDWAKITDAVTLALNLADVTITGSATNTFVLANATTTYSLSATTSYYKNWVLCLTDGSQNSQAYLIKSYSVTAGTATFTLDQIIDSTTGLTYDKANIAEAGVYRYFHKDKTQVNAQSAYYAPSFTTPAGYATETAYRFSGGAGSGVGLKNIKSGYVNRLFFASSGASARHQFTGTYIDQAECFAPATSLLTTSSFTTADANSNVITSATNYDFNTSIGNWAVVDSATPDTHAVKYTSVPLPIFGNGNKIIGYNYITGLGLTSLDNSNGGSTDKYAYLASTYTGSVTSGTAYTLKIKGCSLSLADNRFAKIIVTVSDATYTTTFQSQDMFFTVPTQDGTYSEQSFEFTPTFTGAVQIRFWLDEIDLGASNKMLVNAITISQSSLVIPEVDTKKTYKLWASYVYDGFQESELTYLASKYVTGKYAKLAYELNLKLGTLNKFITGVRLYVSQEDGDTTSATTSTTAPKYLIKDIPIDDDATSTWAFDTSNGKFEYASSFNGEDWKNRGVTWEQKTARTASASTTCSYFLATQASGRIFLADDYDYADSALYVNRLRYTGFNGDGAPTPDIFPNISDVFITTVNAGKSKEIRNIVEYEGDIIILKKSAFLRLDTSNPNPFTCRLDLIKDGVGSRSAQGAYKFDKGLFFTDLYSAYLYDGYQVRDVLKGKWRNLYQSLVTSDTIAISQRVWYNPVNDTIAIAYDTATGVSTTVKYYEFNTDSWLPVLMRNATGYDLNNVVTTSDGVVHFAPTSVGANAFKISTAVGTPLVDVSIDTGYYDMPKGMTGHPKWVYFLAESAISGSTIVVALLGDGASVASGTFTPTAVSKTLYKLPVAQDIPCKMIKVTISQTGAVAPSTQQFKLHKLWVEGEIVPEYTDVTLLPA